MYRIAFTRKFQRDYNLVEKRGLDQNLLNSVVRQLAAGKMLPAKYKDHLLKGQFKGFRECHIQPDWLLMYKIDHEDKVLHMIRTGSHSDLFR